MDICNKKIVERLFLRPLYSNHTQLVGNVWLRNTYFRVWCPFYTVVVHTLTCVTSFVLSFRCRARWTTRQRLRKSQWSTWAWSWSCCLSCCSTYVTVPATMSTKPQDKEKEIRSDLTQLQSKPDDIGANLGCLLKSGFCQFEALTNVSKVRFYIWIKWFHTCLE